jgi:hypothetical protein
MESIA